MWEAGRRAGDAGADVVYIEIGSKRADSVGNIGRSKWTRIRVFITFNSCFLGVYHSFFRPSTPLETTMTMFVSLRWKWRAFWAATYWSCILARHLDIRTWRWKNWSTHHLLSFGDTLHMLLFANRWDSEGVGIHLPCECPFSRLPSHPTWPKQDLGRMTLVEPLLPLLAAVFRTLRGTKL